VFGNTSKYDRVILFLERVEVGFCGPHKTTIPKFARIHIIVNSNNRINPIIIIMAEAGPSDGSVGMKRKLDDIADDDNAQKINKTSSLGEAEEGVTATTISSANGGDPEEGDAAATTAPEKLDLDSSAAPTIEVDTPTNDLMVAPPMASSPDDEPTTTAAVEAPPTVAGNGESLTMDESSKAHDEANATITATENVSVDNNNSDANMEATATITAAENAPVDHNSDNGATDGSSPPAGETAAAAQTNEHSLETTTTTDNGSTVIAAGGGNDGDDETVTMVIPKKQSAAAALAAAAAALVTTTSGTEEEASVPSAVAAATLEGTLSDSPDYAPQPAEVAAATSASKHNTTKTKPGGGVVVSDNPADEFVEEVDELLPEYVGRIIGKGGEMIRDLQARSGCKIDVDQNVAAGAPRIISYKGKRSKVAFAKQLIHLLSVQNVPEDNLPLGEAVEEILAVSASVVGKVIGRGKQRRRHHAFG
jgi:KH domain